MLGSQVASNTSKCCPLVLHELPHDPYRKLQVEDACLLKKHAFSFGKKKTQPRNCYVTRDRDPCEATRSRSRDGDASHGHAKQFHLNFKCPLLRDRDRDASHGHGHDHVNSNNLIGTLPFIVLGSHSQPTCWYQDALPSRFQEFCTNGCATYN